MNMREDNRLKILLRRNNMSQQNFADWFCITRYTAWQILNQKRQLKADEIVKICMRFDVTADWLLELSDIENPFEDAEKYKAIKALIQNE